MSATVRAHRPVPTAPQQSRALTTAEKWAAWLVVGLVCVVGFHALAVLSGGAW